MTDAATTERTAYLLVDGFSMMAFVAATEPLRIANRILGAPRFRWQLVSATGAPVRASNDMRILADAGLTDVSVTTRLAVCSGFLDGRGLDEAAQKHLRAMDTAGAVLGGIDTGCYALAEAGLLNGHRVTLHWESLPAFRERFPQVEAVESLYELAPRRFSCAGGMAATDMALAELHTAFGPALADAVAEQLIHDRFRDPASRQRLSIVKRLGVHNPALVRAIALMETHREPPLSLADIAERVGRSPRQLQRLFETALQTTPGAWYRELRLGHAQALIEATDRPLAEIAIAAGFASATAFSRAFRQRFGVSPSACRRRRSA
ncbi:GlxA family transcriptional regulator [Salinisphaera sp. Q1T1-3]|uniref:GlxA family transcriptional regulator n=1 Tax=Salinisphaera sp. Q1T1-3 TaxID=2321229 RepID=UPI000E719A68|nr:GlxA family transcriptional regulator [Salinisphaera sp. Q1T1-3]RJS93048.1 GlxA family transcriptional regulator [Salinisphaera sp. Q1T1-3]